MTSVRPMTEEERARVMRTPPSYPDMPAIPQDEDGPVFREPWEAQAFAMTLELFDRGHFTWREWVDALSGQIARAEAEGRPDDGSDYYRHWLAALEMLVARKGIADPAVLAERKAAWAHADEHRDFGAPIVLDPDHPHG